MGQCASSIQEAIAKQEEEDRRIAIGGGTEEGLKTRPKGLTGQALADRWAWEREQAANAKYEKEEAERKEWEAREAATDIPFQPYPEPPELADAPAASEAQDAFVDSILYDISLTREAYAKGDVDVNAWNSDGDLAIHRAVYYEDYNRFELLLKWGADPSKRDRYGRTALHYVGKSDYANIADYLLRRLPDMKEKNGGVGFTVDPDAVDFLGETALHAACDRMKDGEPLDSVISILSGYCKREIRNYRGQTALHIAACHCSLAALDQRTYVYLLNTNFAAGYANWLDASGRTAMDVNCSSEADSYYLLHDTRLANEYHMKRRKEIKAPAPTTNPHTTVGSNGETIMMCPNKHPLARCKNTTEGRNWSCDLCKERFVRDSAQSLECRECDYDQCVSCTAATAQLKCPSGHSFVWWKTCAPLNPNDTACSACEKRFPFGSHMMLCYQCGIYHCQSCAYDRAIGKN